MLCKKSLKNYIFIYISINNSGSSTISGVFFCLFWFPNVSVYCHGCQKIPSKHIGQWHDRSPTHKCQSLSISISNWTKDMKICPSITHKLSLLPNQKSYSIESNLSPPIDNRKQTVSSQSGVHRLLQYNFDSKVFLDFLEQLNNTKTKISFHHHAHLTFLK